MSALTYFVALPFLQSGGDDGAILAGEPKEAQSADQAVRMAAAMAAAAAHCGAIAFFRNGDPALGEFDDAVVLKSFGEVDTEMLGDVGPGGKRS